MRLDGTAVQLLSHPIQFDEENVIETIHTSIDPNTRLGYVQLTVRDFDRALPFYQDVLGFKLHERKGNLARLGAGGADLLRLTENPDARPVRRATGLYHFAVLVPSRLHLAHSLRRLADTETPVQGFADHFVSEAIYLADPDGNGIEIYRDRPRRDWYDARGRFNMGTAPLDIEGVLGELENNNGTWTGLDPQTVLGHMHLKIANVPRDQAFYRDLLGFDVMAELPSAAFLSAGGYHHHLGMNTWESAGASPSPPDAVGLDYFTVELPDAEQVQRAVNRVHEAGLPVQETDAGVLIHDPAHNAVVLRTQTAL